MKMNLEIPSFKLSKQLKKAGYKQGKSKFVWYKAKANETDYFEVGIVLCEKIYGLSEAFEGYDIDEEFCICIDAPTVVELGIELPKSVYYNNCWYFYRGYKNSRGLNNEYVHIQYRSNNNKSLHSEIDIEPNARAKMWIYLRKIGLI